MPVGIGCYFICLKQSMSHSILYLEPESLFRMERSGVNLTPQLTPLARLLCPQQPARKLRKQVKEAHRQRALQPGTGGGLGNLHLIVLFMKLCRGFPVGFLMNWFVVET